MSAERVTAEPSAAGPGPARPVTGRGREYCLDEGAGEDFDATAGQLVVDQGAQVGIDGGEDLGELFELGDREPAHRQGLGHFEADVPGADDDRGVRVDLFQGGHHGEGVAHRVQQVHALAGSEGGGSARPPIGGRTGTAPVPMMSLS